MLTDDDIMDALHRVFEVRDMRCGKGMWLQPTEAWPDIVKQSWPGMYFLAPSKVPDGWIDVILAMSEHLEEIEPDVHVIDAFEDLVFGGLSLKVAAPDIESIHAAVSAYEAVAGRMCRVCGGQATIRRTGTGRMQRSRAVCDEHAE